jgi:hypothetical protein
VKNLEMDQTGVTRSRISASIAAAVIANMFSVFVAKPVEKRFQIRLSITHIGSIGLKSIV